jgi:hypothetical protein
MGGKWSNRDNHNHRVYSEVSRREAYRKTFLLRPDKLEPYVPDVDFITIARVLRNRK